MSKLRRCSGLWSGTITFEVKYDEEGDFQYGGAQRRATACDRERRHGRSSRTSSQSFPANNANAGYSRRRGAALHRETIFTSRSTRRLHGYDDQTGRGRGWRPAGGVRHQHLARPALVYRQSNIVGIRAPRRYELFKDYTSPPRRVRRVRGDMSRIRSMSGRTGLTGRSSARVRGFRSTARIPRYRGLRTGSTSTSSIRPVSGRRPDRGHAHVALAADPRARPWAVGVARQRPRAQRVSAEGVEDNERPLRTIGTAALALLRLAGPGSSTNPFALLRELAGRRARSGPK